MLKVDFPEQAPSVCFVCEQATVNMPFVDTKRNFDGGPVTHLDGRKYLCECCVRTAADALGLFDEAKAGLREELSAAVAEKGHLQSMLITFEALEEAMRGLSIPVPKRKPAAK